MARLRSRVTRLVLLDTHAIIHRAYHALPDFTAPDGSPTGALYGLVAMLIKMVNDLDPDYLIACYDLPGPTMRHEAYAGYKATRAKLDDALASQIERSRDIFAVLGVPVYEKPGFEADDLLGTIAHETRSNKDLEVIITSGDMDTLQLVDDERVRVYTIKKGINDTILYDRDAVEKRYGFPPERIPDYKGLAGDPSDNIKGVPGIGEKSATELIKHFGSVEDIYKKLEKDEKVFLKKGIKARTIMLLKEHKEEAEMSKALATIRLDAPISFKLPKEKWRDGVDVQKTLALFDTLGFRTLKARLKSMLGAPAEFSDSPDPHTTDEEGEGASPKQSQIPPERLAEAEAMLWLLASDFTNPTLEDVLAYAKTQDFDEAYTTLEKNLAEAGRVKEVYENIEKPLIPILAEMKTHGVLIDVNILKDLAKRYQAELEKIEKDIYKLAGQEFNISSPKQLGDILFDKLGLTAERQKKTAGGQRSTRESELEKLRDQSPIVGQILDYRELKKLLSTYIENLPPLLDSEHRLHADFLQAGTTTGRMASANPNLQNIPIHSERGRAIRHAFIAPKGFTLVGLDYSQVELRIAAILSGDEKLCAIFKSGRDVHAEVAAMVFGVAADKVDQEMRRRAKVINFGILYGMGANALRQQLGSTTAEAHQFLEDYFHTFTTLAQFLEKTRGFARKHGYTETLFGRRRQFPEMKSPLPYVRAQAERMAINAPIQGTQADIIKLAMVEIENYLKKENASEDAHLLLQVHDELVFEIKNERVAELSGKIKDMMEGVLPEKERHGVPILAVAKAGKDWGDMQPLDK